MHISRTLCLGLTLTGAFAFLNAAAHPAAAQELTYQLTDVTFDDGATASGYFDFDPTTQTLGPYDFTTTNGTSDGEVGDTYMPGTGQFNYINDSSFSYFGISSNSATGNFIAFVTNGSATSSGTFALLPGTVIDSEAFADSGEFAPFARSISGGFLVVSPAAIPEASSVVSFSLLLALGGMVIATKRRKAAPAA